MTLPTSFVERYGMRGGIELLKRNSNCDDPLPIERLGDRFEWRWPTAPDCVAEGRLIFMFENQAVSVSDVRCSVLARLGRVCDPADELFRGQVTELRAHDDSRRRIELPALVFRQERDGMREKVRPLASRTRSDGWNVQVTHSDGKNRLQN